MDKYKILSHTADLRLEIYGKTQEELFQNAASAMADILASSIKHQASGKLKERIKIESANVNILLVDFLNEILARSNINKCVYKASSIKHQASKKEIKIEADLVGYKVKEFDEDIKAVTYHEAEVKEKGGFWKAKLVLDI